MTPTWLAIAEQELGVKEIAGKEHHPRILEYHETTTLNERAAGRDETPWCSSFVNWCLEQAGYVGTDSALASSWLGWGIEEVDPKLGAIAVIRRREKGFDSSTGSRTGNHVGLVAEGLVQRGMLLLLSGNARDQVKHSRYPLSKYEVRGYRWPVLRSS